MKILFDTNVILDLLLDREPFSTNSAYLISKVEKGKFIGYLCATTITTIHYLLYKSIGEKESKKHLKTLLSIFEIAPVNRKVIENALKSKFKDFEDAVLHEAAVNIGAEIIISRNIKDFKNSIIPVFIPEEFIGIIEKI